MPAEQHNLQFKGSVAIFNLKYSMLNRSTIRSSKKMNSNNEPLSAIHPIRSSKKVNSKNEAMPCSLAPQLPCSLSFLEKNEFK
jgi:hypothetical protein